METRTMELAQLDCTTRRDDESPLTDDEIAQLRTFVPQWEFVQQNGIKHLTRTFGFADFAQALAFTVQVGTVAEAEGHHPSLMTGWGRVTVTWWTHRIKGLHRNDFIMAAKTDRLYVSR
jgi:4a-hydroxytetrahydrobiopterin dehydratase